MLKAALLPLAVLLAILAAPRSAHAQDMSMPNASSATGIGVGVESLLSGPTGPTIVYQTPAFHIDGLLGFEHTQGDTTAILLAGRFYYQVHAGELSDFSIGGGVGMLNIDADAGNNTDLHLEAGAKIRVFLAPNVALSSSLGLAMVFSDGADFTGVVGDLQGTMGITYFFF
jgi:hypothetical protein